MLSLIGRAVVASLLVASCGKDVYDHPTTVAGHEDLARHYEATARSIEDQCFKDRRHELTVDDPAACWKAQDVRFLDANVNAAAQEHAAADRLRAAQPAPSASASR